MKALPTAWQAAPEYSQLGLRIVPVNGKVPLLTDWPNKASCDEAQIRELAQKHPTANIAVIVPKGWLVVDVDIRADGDGRETLQALENEFGKLPDTMTAKSGVVVFTYGSRCHLNLTPNYQRLQVSKSTFSVQVN